MNLRKTMIALATVLLSAAGFTLLGLFIDISIILRYDYTPISFTFTFLFIGTLFGLLLALRTTSHG